MINISDSFCLLLHEIVSFTLALANSGIYNQVLHADDLVFAVCNQGVVKVKDKKGLATSPPLFEPFIVARDASFTLRFTPT